MKFTHSLRPTSPRSTSVLQFFSLPISRSLVLDPRSPFPIFDCRSASVRKREFPNLVPRLDYQPLFGKMSPHSSPRSLSSGRIRDRTRETVEIEPTSFPVVTQKYIFIVASKRLGTRLEFRWKQWKPFWKRAGDDYNFWIRRISQRLGNVCSSETMGRSSSKHKV